MSRNWNLQTDEVACIALFSGTCGYALAKVVVISSGNRPESIEREIWALVLWVVLTAGILMDCRRKSRRRAIADTQ